jgi:hypothetical protein
MALHSTWSSNLNTCEAAHSGWTGANSPRYSGPTSKLYIATKLRDIIKNVDVM